MRSVVGGDRWKIMVFARQLEGVQAPLGDPITLRKIPRFTRLEQEFACRKDFRGFQC